uniref:Carboxylesterase type B domain-containing protein n=1 Tax=Anopheles culicifacies TaxID=139723 RepID=A0A182LUK3_9DIPT
MPIVEFWIALSTTVLLVAGFGLCLILDKRRSVWVDRRFPGTGRTCVVYGDFKPAGRTEHRMYTIQRLYREFKAKKWPIGGAVMYLTPCVIPTDPKLIEYMLGDEYEKLSGRNTSNGERFRAWWNAFEDEHFESLIDVATEESEQLTERLCTSNSPVDAKAITELFVARALTRCIFGKRYTEDNDKLPLTEKLAKHPSGTVWEVISNAFPNARFTRILRKVLEHIEEHPLILEELIGSISTESTTDANFLQYSKHLEQQASATDRMAFEDTKTLMLELVQNVFYVASGTIIASLFEMGHNPKIQSNLHQVLKRSDDSMVDFLDKVIGETLRKYPPVDEISFTTGANHRLPRGELVVPKNTKVIIPIYALHHDAEFYPDPNRFDPERPILRSTKESMLYRPLGGVPFPIGSNLALLIVRVGLGNILTKCTDRPVIHTTGGQVQGTTESCGLFCTYYSFKGIPYAEPPVGGLRFTDPVPHGGWTGVRDASQHGSSCPSPDNLPTEAEDCLFVNVYTPSLVGTRPVMVFVHGGAYSSGSGDDVLYGARYFMPEDVVIVTINYRIGVLGFLSTGDGSASGNWAIKDCVEALRWVQSNILVFGGDPSQVTIFGQSAGGAMVHFLTISPLTTGLFQRAITHSGSTLNAWSLQPNPRAEANRLASALGISTSDTTSMVAALRQVPYRELVALQTGLHGQDVPLLLRPIDFGPVVEPANAPGPVALDRLPIEIIESGSYRAVPLMAGYVDMDSLLFSAVEMAVNPGVFDTFNNNPHLLVPFFWNIPEGSAASTAVSDTFRQYYWQGQPLSAALLSEFSVYLTDHQFAYPQLEMAKRHAARSSVYLYQFRYDGDLNLVKQSTGISLPGALHGDELCYLFDPTSLAVGELPVTSHAITVRQRMVRMWTNFARVGTPTPTLDALLQNTIWRPISAGMIDATLNIGHDLVMETNPIASRYNQWQELAQRYANNIFRI